MPNIVVKQENQKKIYWIQYANQRISQNKNLLITISGQTGSGKSWTAASIAEQIDKDFNVNRIVFSGQELMKLINSDKLKKGSVIVWDEAGVDLSNRSWQSTTNKLLNHLLQTFRHRCFILIFTAPYMNFIDSATRRLFHAEFQTVSIDYKERTVKVRPQLIQYNSRLNKFYYKWLRIVTKGDGVVPLVEWNVKAPNKELIKQYEEKKTMFTNQLNAEIESELVADKRRKGKNKPLTERQEKILSCWLRGIFFQKDIATEIGTDQSVICNNEKWMFNKGYDKGTYKKAQNKNVLLHKPTN